MNTRILVGCGLQKDGSVGKLALTVAIYIGLMKNENARDTLILSFLSLGALALGRVSPLAPRGATTPFRVPRPSPILGVFVFVTACSQPSTQTTPMAAKTPAACPAPVRIAVLQDKTGSANSTRTPQLEVGDLTPLFDLLRRCGGELRVGTVHDRSDETLVPLRVPEPPQLPSRSATAGKGSILRLVEERSLAGDRARIAADAARWQTETEAAVQKFSREVERLLAEPPHARSSDVFGAIMRADLFLSEPEAGVTRPSRRYLLAVTDGVHTAAPSRDSVRLQSGAILIVLNGEGSLGVLQAFMPLRFEGLEAALRYVVADATAGDGLVRRINVPEPCEEETGCPR